MSFTANDHTFVICAYKECKYLEECILSLVEQKIKSSILITTSTPNNHIKRLAEKYHISLYIRDGESNIADDWNFAYQRAETKLVTIAHQDDVYCENYLSDLLQRINSAVDPLIAFGDYAEIRGENIIRNNRLLSIKKTMLFPLRCSKLWNSRFVRRRILSFGSAICCPSVTFLKEKLPDKPFANGYQSDLDWQAWERISKMKGSFVYCNTLLMLHRIHGESVTTQIIANSDRTKEDFDMYCKFWPKWIAKWLVKFYSKSQESNQI